MDRVLLNRPQAQKSADVTARTASSPAQGSRSRPQKAPASTPDFDFSRVSIAPADDSRERSAEQKAAEVMRSDQKPDKRRPIASVSSSRQNSLVPGSGHPVDEAARSFLEPRLGFDFRNIRVHSGPEAAASAHALGAQAYTLGSDLVFDAGQYSPSTHTGLHLLAHELAHTISPGSPNVLWRQQAKTRTWDEIWKEFELARGTSVSKGPGEADNPELATTLANELAKTPASGDQLLEHGIELVFWLQSHGSQAAASEVLVKVHKAVPSGKLAKGQGGSVFMSVGGEQDPEILINQGRQAASAGNHEQAAQLLGVANEMLWLYVRDVSTEKSFGTPSVMQYPTLSGLYERLRKIYAVYPDLEEAALQAGDKKRAQDAREHGEALRDRLVKEFTPKDVDPKGDAELAEVMLVKKSSGDALRLIGVNDETTDLTELPGLSPPTQVADPGGHATLQENIGDLQTALMGQVDLQRELASEPEIRKAFPKGGIDLNETGTRLKVWGIMYKAHQASDPDPLGSLMTLIGKYLKAYTHHTFYNVRDFGENYITSKFPVDAAGQAERDCGVYALMVAWDVFETVKHGKGPKVNFRLDVMLDHIILVMDDTSTDRTYIVSNDQITSVDPAKLPPPVSEELKGSPAYEARSAQGGRIKRDSGEAESRAYANVRNLPYLVSPEILAPLGSTDKSEAAFRNEAWNAYEAKTAHATDVTKDLDARIAAVNSKLPPGKHGVIAGTFEAQEAMNNSLRDLDATLDGMQKLGGAELAQAVNGELVNAAALLALFEMIARSDKGPAADRPVQVGWAGQVHPLVRFAQLIRGVQASGGALSATFSGMRKGKQTMLSATDFVDQVRGFFGTNDLPLP